MEDGAAARPHVADHHGGRERALRSLDQEGHVDLVPEEVREDEAADGHVPKTQGEAGRREEEETGDTKREGKGDKSRDKEKEQERKTVNQTGDR